MRDTFGSRLKAQRENAGLTQRQVAEQLEIAPSWLSMMETDKANPTKTIIDSLAALYGCTPNYLFGFAPDSDAQKSESLQAQINELACIARNLQSILERAQTKELA